MLQNGACSSRLNKLELVARKLEASEMVHVQEFLNHLSARTAENYVELILGLLKSFFTCFFSIETQLFVRPSIFENCEL